MLWQCVMFASDHMLDDRGYLFVCFAQTFGIHVQSKDMEDQMYIVIAIQMILTQR